MDFRDLKKSMEKIEMSDEMENRIITNCRLAAVQEMEENTMKKRVHFNFKKSMALAAIVALGLFACMAAAAAVHFGQFKDITNWNGAVIGTAYEQATNEIEVSVAAAQDELTVIATMLSSNTAPYREIETFGISDYRIVDMSGNVIVEGESTDMVEIMDGVAKLCVPLDGVDSGNYKLLVNAFIGGSKADQPLTISGSWECDFTV